MKYNTQEDLVIIEGVKKCLSWDDISTQVHSQCNTGRTAESVRDRYRKMRKADDSLMAKNPNTQSLSCEEKAEEPKFTVKGKQVEWEYKHGLMSLTLETLDNMFYQYSKHGLNMTQVQVQNKNGLTAIQYQSLKRTFDLVKDSDVFSPYTLSLYEGKEQTEMISEKIAEKYSSRNIRDVIVHKTDSQRNKAYKQAIEKVGELEYKRQLFEDAILDYISKAKVCKAPRTKDIKVKEAIVHVADLHIGAEIEAERNLPAFNADVVLERLLVIAKETNARKIGEVTLVINGDLIETFTGLSHINSWKNIDKKYGYGVNATIKTTEIITDFLSSLNNVVKVVITSGNHDRVTSNNKEDVGGEVAQWTHYMLQSRFGHLFDLEWCKDVFSMKMNGCGFVLTHGHLSISKKAPDHIVNHYGFPGIFNLVVMAHLHTRKVLSDNLMNRTIHAPSIFTGNNYSKNLGYSTLAGYLLITVNEGLPTVLDCPLK